MVIYGIDPGLYRLGYVKIDTEKKTFAFDCLTQERIEDLSLLYKILFRRFKNTFSDGDFYFIEDVIFYPIRGRKVQAQVWCSVAFILAVIPRKAGYLLISPNKTKRLKIDLEKLEGLLKVKDLKKDEKEHVIDAFKVFLVGLKEVEYSEKVLEVLKELSLL